MSRRRNMRSSSSSAKRPSVPSSSTSPSPKKSKMRNTPCEVDGLRFASKKEAGRYQELKLMLRAGEIGDLQVHPSYELRVNDQLVCRYIADFSYFPKGARGAKQRVVEDVKGRKSGGAWEIFRVKAKLFRALYGFDVTVL